MELSRLHRTLAFEIGELHTATGDLADAAGTMAGAARTGAIADLAKDVAARQDVQRRRLDATLGALGVNRLPVSSPVMTSILDQRWRAQRHRIGHPLLDAYIVGTALQNALHYLGTVLVLAAARAERLDEVDATRFLREAFDEVLDIRRRVARATGLPAATIETAEALPPGWYALQRRYGH
jgi:hypothetical protein